MLSVQILLLLFQQFKLVFSEINPQLKGDFVDWNLSSWCQHNKTLFVFGDEFQSLYEIRSENKSENRKIIRELLAVGKSAWSVGIISGSSAATSALAHKDPNFFF